MFLRLFMKAIGWRLFSIIITTTVAFVLLDDNATLAITIGLMDTVVKFFAYSGYDLFWQKVVNRKRKPAVIWFTGLSGSGKSTLAYLLKSHLVARGQPAIVLDGDQIRSIFPKTGFDRESREQHIRQTANMAALLEAQGITAIVSLISPYQSSRNYARGLAKRFIEIHMADDVSTCQKRDVKGLYAKVARGEIKNFTGVNDPYEAPDCPELVFHTKDFTISQCIKHILRRFRDEAGYR